MTAPRVSRRRASRGLGRLFVGSVLGASAVMILVPLAWMVYIAFQTPRRINEPGFGWDFSLYNFERLFGPGEDYGQQVVNSILIVAGATLLCLICGSLAGYSLSQLNWSRKVTFTVLGGAALLQLIPPMTLVPGLYVTLVNMGLLDTLWGLIALNTVFNLPFATILMKFYFDTLPPELREAASIDGANETRTFLGVMLPLAGPGVGAVSIFIAIQVWNEFLFGLVFTSGGAESPITVGIATFIQPQALEFGPMAAIGVVTAIPIVLLAIVANRQIVAGLTQGAVKG
ncbi:MULTISPECIES: carbohydrate ABC transporter permease [Microbacterium]|uniref:carbohydrate ABC transporter permease n=1 Tax=Microbacterium TaxID=33882 RepID=UPI0022F01230|nr:carbohydrate ABC transporter permease [Streptomyces sp. MS2A]